MEQDIIFLAPAFQERIWGGKKLQSIYGYDIPHEQTGEAWVISAHEHGPSLVLNGALKGKTLRTAWEQYPALFGQASGEREFPLLVKIIDANDRLSVQVHPDDTYAQEVENEPYGKTECWYVLDCEENSEIIYGHQAQSKEEFERLMALDQWDELLTYVPVKPGDFYYVPSGMIHAIGKGIVILEIQQSSDITYRLYDYDRKDAEGHRRELHLESALAVTNYPHTSKALAHVEEKVGDMERRELIKEPYFTVDHWKIRGEVTRAVKVDYLLVSVIEGNGKVTVKEQTYSLQKGDHFIVPTSTDTFSLNGTFELIVAYE